MCVSSLAMTSSDNGFPRYVAIEGPIGVGKTTLALKLSKRLQARLVLEEAEEVDARSDIFALGCLLYLLTRETRRRKSR